MGKVGHTWSRSEPLTHRPRSFRSFQCPVGLHLSPLRFGTGLCKESVLSVRSRDGGDSPAHLCLFLLSDSQGSPGKPCREPGPILWVTLLWQSEAQDVDSMPLF